MNLVELIGGEYRRCGSKHGGEYSGACPFCGDGGKGKGSDRFHIWPGQGTMGRAWCRICGWNGDAIQFLRERDGIGFKDACVQLGVEAEMLSKQPVRAIVQAGFVPAEVQGPAEKWRDRAGKFAEYCHLQLLGNREQMQWLAARGIFAPLVEHYRLGWNPSPAWRERGAWGLEKELKDNGQEKKLWLPMGLVIPLLEDGSVLRLRIRQPDGDPRYYVVPGSVRTPLVSRPAEGLVVVESELDAIALDGIAGDIAGIIAMGNSTAKPPARLHAILQAALHISVSLDSDKPRQNKTTGRTEIPGGQASRWWLEQYRQAERVPVVGGKDPGDAYAAGVDLRAWVLAGMPPYFQIKAGMERPGKIAAAVPPVEAPEAAGPDGEARTITLKDGRTFTLTDAQKEWEAVTDAGGVAFSGNELRRLQPVFAGMEPEERSAATSLVMDVKEVFPGAYIKDGRAE